MWEESFAGSSPIPAPAALRVHVFHHFSRSIAYGYPQMYPTGTPVPAAALGSEVKL